MPTVPEQVGQVGSLPKQKQTRRMNTYLSFSGLFDEYTKEAIKPAEDSLFQLIIVGKRDNYKQDEPELPNLVPHS